MRHFTFNVSLSDTYTKKSLALWRREGDVYVLRCVSWVAGESRGKYSLHWQRQSFKFRKYLFKLCIFPFSVFHWILISQISNISLVGSKTLQYKVSYQVPYVLYHVCRIPWTMCNYMLFEWKCECWFWSFWIMGNRRNIQETSSSMNQSSTIYSEYNKKDIKERSVGISSYIEDGQKIWIVDMCCKT